MTERSSSCKVCQDPILDTGNYSMKIVRGKRVPKKAKKVHLELDSSVWGLTKFQKYLLKNSTSKNYMVITCATCKSVVTYPMTKKHLAERKTHKSGQNTSAGDAKSKKKRKRRGKDAGLILPESFRRSASVASSSKESTPSRSPAVFHQSHHHRSGPKKVQTRSAVAHQNRVRSQTQSALQRALFKSSSNETSNKNPLQKFFK